ncbi:uncharacterized protein RB166_001822 [Leptodactylus fuscus]
MEKHRQEESGLFAAPFAVSLSPVLFSEEEDSEYDFLNPADRQENTIVLFRNDRSAVHCMSSEDSPSPTPTYVYKPGDRSHSPSCTESEEETELSYNSPTLLLEISSSSSSTSVPEESHFTDNYKEQVLAFGAWIKSSSDSSSDCECNNCNPQSIRESKYDENIPSVRMSPHDQVKIIFQKWLSTSIARHH